MKDFIQNRFKEGSTWHGLFWVIASFGLYSFNSEQVEAITALGMAIAGSTAVVIPDGVFKKLHPSK